MKSSKRVKRSEHEVEPNLSVDKESPAVKCCRRASYRRHKSEVAALPSRSASSVSNQNSVPSYDKYDLFEFARQRLKDESEGLPPWHTQLPKPRVSSPKKKSNSELNDRLLAEGGIGSRLRIQEAAVRKGRKKVQLVRLSSNNAPGKRRVCSKKSHIITESLPSKDGPVGDKAANPVLIATESSQSDPRLPSTSAIYDSSWSDDIFNMTFDYSQDDACPASQYDSNEELPVGVTWRVDPGNFGSGDIIWVRFKKFPFWPALVIKRQKISKVDYVTYLFIEYTEDGRLKYIKPERKRYCKKNMFLISENYAKIKAEGMASKLSESFSASIDKVDEYRFLPLPSDTKERIIAASRFFGWTIAPRKGHTGDSSTQVADGGESAVVSSQSTCASIFSSQSSKNSVDTDDDDVTPPAKVVREYSEETLKKIAERNCHLDALLKFIETKECKEHLCNVHLGKTKSSFKSDYEVMKKTPKGQFQLSVLGYGPFSSSQTHLEKVINAIQLRVFNSNRRILDEVGSSEPLLYIMRALVPEAVVTALQHVDKLNREQAMDVFYEGPCFTSEEL